MKRLESSSFTSSARSSSLFVAISALLHALAMWSLSAMNSDEDAPEFPYEFEIDIAPEAPEAPEAPGHENEQDEPTRDKESTKTAIESESADVMAIDAGVVDASMADGHALGDAGDAGVIDASMADGHALDDAGDAGDAGVVDASMADGHALGDAGDAGDAGVVDAGDAGDAGPDTSSVLLASRNTDLGSTPQQTREGGNGTTDAGTGGGDAGVRAGSIVVGVGVDLGKVTPKKDHLAVVIRFDRMRGTPWAERTESILKPMPDYGLIIGKRKLRIADSFDLLLISTSDPRNVTATNLATRTTLRPSSARKFLEHKDVAIDWSPVAGGALGQFSVSGRRSPDPRVYLTPLANWIILVDPKHLGALTRARNGALDVTPTPASLPSWLQKIPQVVSLTGTSTEIVGGPAIAASIRGLPRSVDIPLVGSLPAPQHVTVGLWIDPLGLIARGTLQFTTPARATLFITTAEAAKRDLLASRLRMLALRRFHGYHAIRGLSFRQKGSTVSFATSVSNPDGIAMTRAAAEQANAWYARQRRPAVAPKKPIDKRLSPTNDAPSLSPTDR